MKKLLTVLILTISSLAFGHDMWIVTDVAGAEQKVCARIGETFPGTVNAPTADRVSRFELHAAGGPQKLTGTFGDKQFCAPLPPGTNGIAEIIVQPRLNQIDAKRFGDFVRMEGLEHVVKPAAVASTDAPVKYLYSRYSKAIVGRPTVSAIRSSLGHVLEIVPQQDPRSLKAGESLRVQVLFRGQPLAGAQVAAVNEGASGESGKFPVTARTDQNGMAELKLHKPGLWYARLIHTIRMNDPEFEWHHFFSTITFTVGSESGTAKN